VKEWPTPRAQERSQRNSADNGVALSLAVKEWPTPTASDRNGPTRGASAQGGAPLSEAVKASGSAWPTPTARDWRSGKVGASTLARDNARPLSEAVESESLLWATPTRADGLGGPGNSGREGGENLRTQAAGSLSPAWEECLMGFPAGWTHIDGPPVVAKRSTNGSRPARKRASRSAKSG
jgi:hypothetical protein